MGPTLSFLASFSEETGGGSTWSLYGSNGGPSGVAIASGTGNIWLAPRDNANITIGEIEIFNPAGKLLKKITRGLV